MPAYLVAEVSRRGETAAAVATKARRRPRGVKVRHCVGVEAGGRRGGALPGLLVLAGHDAQQVPAPRVRLDHEVRLLALLLRRGALLGGRRGFRLLKLDALERRDPERQQLVVIVVREGCVCGLARCCRVVTANNILCITITILKYIRTHLVSKVSRLVSVIFILSPTAIPTDTAIYSGLSTVNSSNALLQEFVQSGNVV